jgi:hypothetical protein
MTQLVTSNGNYSLINRAYPGGFDGGNEDTCFATVDHDGRERVLVIPSAVAEITSNKLDLLRSAMHGSNDQSDSYQQDIDVQYRGHRYSVGYMTYRQRKEAGTQRGDESRYSSIEQIVRFLASSGLVIEEPEYSIELITTVPVKYFSNKLRLEVRNAFEGEHEFILNGVGRKCTIHVKKIMVEGPPAMALYGAATARARRIIIDGGRHTTELLTLDGRDPISDLCRGVEIGVQRIADYLYDKISEMYDRRLTTREQSDIIRAYGSRNSARPLAYPEIACGVHVLSAAELAVLTRTGAQNLADELLKEAGSLWGNVNGAVAGDIVHQFFMGGMPLFISEEMHMKMPRLSVVATPEQANARGCAQVARAMMMK